MEINIQRIFHLLKKDWKDLVVPFFKVIVIIFLFLTIIPVIANKQNQMMSLSFSYNFISFLLISAGIFGSLSFAEISKLSTRVEYLTLSASNIEKTISKAITVLICFPVLILILYSLCYYLLYGIAQVINFEFNHMLLFEHDNLLLYLLLTGLISSFFSYGSVKYNNNSFVKIIIRLLLGFLIWVLILFLSGLIIFPELWVEVKHELFGIERTVHYSGNPPNISNDFWLFHFLKFAFHYLLLPFIWVLIYFEIKEKQA